MGQGISFAAKEAPTKGDRTDGESLCPLAPANEGIALFDSSGYSLYSKVPMARTLMSRLAESTNGQSRRWDSGGLGKRRLQAISKTLVTLAGALAMETMLHYYVWLSEAPSITKQRRPTETRTT